MAPGRDSAHREQIFYSQCESSQVLATRIVTYEQSDS